MAAWATARMTDPSLRARLTASLAGVMVRLAEPHERVQWDATVERYHYLGFKRFAGVNTDLKFPRSAEECQVFCVGSVYKMYAFMVCSF